MSALSLHSKTGWTLEYIETIPKEKLELYLAWYRIEADYNDPDSKRYKQAEKRRHEKKMREKEEALRENIPNAKLLTSISTNPTNSPNSNELPAGIVNLGN